VCGVAVESGYVNSTSIFCLHQLVRLFIVASVREHPCPAKQLVLDYFPVEPLMFQLKFVAGQFDEKLPVRRINTSLLLGSHEF